MKNGELLVHCHAGCAFEAIKRALDNPIRPTGSVVRRNGRANGGGWTSITLAQLAADKALPLDFLVGLGVHDLPNGRGVGIQYRDAMGQTVATKRRTALSARDGSYWPEGLRLLAYGLDRWRMSVERSGFGIVVEGESDCWTGWLHDLPVLGLPGANTVHVTLSEELVTGVDTLVVIEEPDNGGQAFTANVRRRLEELEWTGSLAIVRPGVDLNDLHKADPEKFATTLSDAFDAAEVITNDGAPKPPTPEQGEAASWPIPEDRGRAALSPLGDIEYIEDLIRPGRITVWAAEEGSGKSYAVDDELAIRIAVAGGSFAGTWPILRNGPVLVLSEMHPDDDFIREDTVLQSLGLDRSALRERYFRLPLMTAANGQPALTVADWRAWITAWLKERGALLLVADTATGATQIAPWGSEIQTVYRDLRVMLETYPELAIILVVHVKKPNGRSERRISDVLGEWGRWCDVVVMQEVDGPGRVKLSTYKRVRKQRRILATQANGLLVDARDVSAGGERKVPGDKVVATITAEPGLTIAELAARLGVKKRTASGYVDAAVTAGKARREATGQRNTFVVYPADAA